MNLVETPCPFSRHYNSKVNAECLPVVIANSSPPIRHAKPDASLTYTDALKPRRHGFDQLKDPKKDPRFGLK